MKIKQTKKKKLKYVKSKDRWYDAKKFKERWDDIKYFTDKEAILLNLEEKTEKELLKKLGRENKPQVIIIDGVNGVEEEMTIRDLKNLQRNMNENKECWNNYIGRETKKKNEGHKSSYDTLKEEEYMNMVKMFKKYQYIYENKEKYRNIKIKNDNKSWKKKLRVIRKHEFEGIIYLAHDHEMSEHFEIDTTYDRIKDKYYWKRMRNDVETYVKSYNSCQRRGKLIGKHELNTIKVIEPFYQIGIDIIGPLKITERRNKYIITAMDYFTK
ncbi:hypothetical protein C1646_775345 [Rhizophagus diaphanus]|nr:hypothetical protein C1646_775345 [Rhizophagus diaphanus] [Rhizophagus sp. MUCL 43196]